MLFGNYHLWCYQDIFFISWRSFVLCFLCYDGWMWKLIFPISEFVLCINTFISMACEWKSFFLMEVSTFLLRCLFPWRNIGIKCIVVVWLSVCVLVTYFFLSTTLQIRMWQRDSRDRTALQPTPAAAIDVSQMPLFSNVIFSLQLWENTDDWKHDGALFWTCCIFMYIVTFSS